MQLHDKVLRSAALACCALLTLCCVPVAAHAQECKPAQSTAAPDNSAHNKAHNKTADQQAENDTDRTITQNIRKALMADKSLSTYGHNVKIITVNGAVTLKGPVHSEEEKQSIAAKAAEVAGQDKVSNQLTVK
jgi:osmotically-inducible protein OsmY